MMADIDWLRGILLYSMEPLRLDTICWETLSKLYFSLQNFKVRLLFEKKRGTKYRISAQPSYWVTKKLPTVPGLSWQR